jgi:hypothetical protein
LLDPERVDSGEDMVQLAWLFDDEEWVGQPPFKDPVAGKRDRAAKVRSPTGPKRRRGSTRRRSPPNRLPADVSLTAARSLPKLWLQSTGRRSFRLRQAPECSPRTGRPARVSAPPPWRSERARAARGLVPPLPTEDARQRYRKSEGASVSFPILSGGAVVGIVSHRRDVTELADRLLAGIWAFLHSLAAHQSQPPR